MLRVAVLVALLLDSALLAAMELLFQPLYAGPVPLPVGTVMILVTLPWLTRAAVDVSTALPVAAAPFAVWAVVTGVLGFAGPGGDVLLPSTWQSLLLLVAGLLTGVISLRRALERRYAEQAPGPPPQRPANPARTR